MRTIPLGTGANTPTAGGSAAAPISPWIVDPRPCNRKREGEASVKRKVTVGALGMGNPRRDVEKRRSAILPERLWRLWLFRDHVARRSGAAKRDPIRTGQRDQEDLPTQQSPTQAKARIPSSDEDARRPRDIEASAGEGTHPLVCVTSDLPRKSDATTPDPHQNA